MNLWAFTNIFRRSIRGNLSSRCALKPDSRQKCILSSLPMVTNCNSSESQDQLTKTSIQLFQSLLFYSNMVWWIQLILGSSINLIKHLLSSQLRLATMSGLEISEAISTPELMKLSIPTFKTKSSSISAFQTMLTKTCLLWLITSKSWHQNTRKSHTSVTQWAPQSCSDKQLSIPVLSKTTSARS